MFESGDWLVPRLAGEPFLEKPPLFWWTMAASFRLLGVSEVAARLPALLFGLLTLVVVFDMARRFAGVRAGLLAVGVACTFVNSNHMLRLTTDPALAFFVAAGYWAFQRGAFGDPANTGRGKPRWGWILLVYLAAGCAFLSKGIVGVGLILGPVTLLALGTRRWSLLLHPAHLPGLLLLALSCSAWPYLLYQRGGRELLDGFLIDNVKDRFASDGRGAYRGGHHNPFYYHLLHAPLELAPWIFVLPSLYRSMVRGRLPGGLPRGFVSCSLVFPIGLLLLSIPTTKRTLYLLPLLAPLAVAVGVWLERTEEDSEGWSVLPRKLVVGFTLVLFVLFAMAGGAVLVGSVGLSLSDSIDTLAQGGRGAPWLAGGLLVVSLGACGVLLRRLRTQESLGWVAVTGSVALWAVLQGLVFPLLDPVKDLRPFVRDLEASGVFESELVGYRLDETTPGALAFYAGQVLREIPTEDALSAWMDTHPHTRVLMLERRWKAVSDELSARFRTRDRWPYSSHRVYVVLEPVAAPTAGDE
jgi:4-amino-4-deoxy-L-arabinose transferase-like glycosyltransferase